MVMNSQESQREMHLVDLWRIVVRYRIVVAVITVAIVSLVFVSSFFSTPRYRASILIAPAGNEADATGLAGLSGQLGGLAAIAGLRIGSSGISKSKTIATIRSHAFTEKFIQDEGLMPVLFAELWDAENSRWTVEDPAAVPTPRDAYTRFDQNMRFISEDPQTGLITMSIEWWDREQAASWANLLVERVNNTIRMRAIEEAQKSIDFLNEELDKTSIVELQQMIYGLIESQINTIMLANVRQQYALEVVDPAVIPDPDQYINPRTGLKMALGLVIGFFLALALAVFHDFLQREKRGQGDVK